ncbi:MAG: DUF2802 domain-containing protein [Methylococcales bacterium]|nr:DUF2802 domain-containing protein [Methylococcales bacterium]
MDNPLLIVLFVITIIIVSVLVWLLQGYKKLKQDYRILSNSINRNTNDITGLCSAAVSVDTRVSDNNEQLNGIMEKMTDIEQNEQHTNLPYHTAIQRVRNGASIDDLVQQCGLSQEEAVLLIRLHGDK